MLTKILTVLGNVLLNVIIHRIQLWWAKRQAEYYKRKAEVHRKRQESLQEAQAAELAIQKAGDTAVLHASEAKLWEERIKELRRRAEERSGREQD